MRTPTKLIALTLAAAAGGCFLTPISRQSGPFAPKTPGYALNDGEVTREGRPELKVVQTNVDRYMTNYELKGTDGSTQAQITFMSGYAGALGVRAAFPTIGEHYEARMPIAPFNDLLASYIDNGVLKGGRVDADGLKAYAETRGIQLVDTGAQVKRLSAAGHRSVCERCLEDFRRCQVEASERRAHPAAGVSFSTSCASQYQACSQGGIATRPNDWPCGETPG